MNYARLVAVAALCIGGAVSAAEIRLLAAGATEKIISELVPAFESATGHKVVAIWAGTVDIKRRIAAGEVFDAVIVGSAEVEAFIEQGKVVSGSRVAEAGCAKRSANPVTDGMPRAGVTGEAKMATALVNALMRHDFALRGRRVYC